MVVGSDRKGYKIKSCITILSPHQVRSQHLKEIDINSTCCPIRFKEYEIDTNIFFTCKTMEKYCYNWGPRTFVPSSLSDLISYAATIQDKDNNKRLLDAMILIM